MKFGYACIPLATHYKTTKKFSLKNFNDEILINCIESNLLGLLEILKYNLHNNIKMFRISSDIIPFGSHEVNNFNWQEHFKELLLTIGDFANKNNIRLSMHPGQYTVLNSPDPAIVNRSIKDLQYHTDFLDSLNMDSSNKLILHVGGVYNDKPSAINRFIKTYSSLDSSIKKRLIIENDEKNFSLYDLLNLSLKIGTPIVLDNLHYFCMENHVHTYRDLTDAFSTWRPSDGIPKVHYSEQAINRRIGSHSNTIHLKNLTDYLNISKNLDFDIMLEVKDKDFSAIKATNFLNKISSKKDLEKQLDIYKYYLLEKSTSTYDIGHDIIMNDGIESFLYYIDSLEDTLNTNSLTALKSFSSNLTLKKSERNYLDKLLLLEDTFKIKAYLLKVILRQNDDSLLSNYFLFT